MHEVAPRALVLLQLRRVLQLLERARRRPLRLVAQLRRMLLQEAAGGRHVAEPARDANEAVQQDREAQPAQLALQRCGAAVEPLAPPAEALDVPRALLLGVQVEAEPQTLAAVHPSVGRERLSWRGTGGVSSRRGDRGDSSVAAERRRRRDGDGGGGGGGGGGGERRERLLEQPVDANRARAAPACVLVAVLREVVAGLRVGPVHHHGSKKGSKEASESWLLLPAFALAS